MIKINKVNNSLTVEGVDNVFYPNNGQNSYPLNSLIVVIDNSNMATFRSVATNDVLFSGLIEDITINGEAVTKDNIITKFDAVSNSTSTGGGGGSVDAYTKTESDAKYATKDELTAVETVANDADTKVDALTPRVEGVETSLGNKQDTLVSGANIKTINNQSILGEGNIEISDYYTKTEADEIFATTTQVNHQAADISALQTDMRGKQATLVSGENIKTINSESILGSGDIQINGVSDEQAQEIAKIPTLETELAQKVNVSDVPTVQIGSVGTNKNYIYSSGQISVDNYGVVRNIQRGAANTNVVKLEVYQWGDSRKAKEVILAPATTTAAGVMSAADKTKLDSIPETIPSQSEIDGIAANVSALETAMNGKQDTLVSGTNIKTINNQSILGEGNIEISDYYTKTEADEIFATTTQVNHQAADISALQTDMRGKQATLVSGENIKTINGESVLGEGNIEVAKKTDIPSTDNLATKDELTAVETVANNADAKADAATSKVEGVETALGNKQDTLVSGTNIKTINSQSIIGSGDLAISGVSDEQAQEIAKIPTIETELAQKANTSDVPTVQTDRIGTNKNYIYSDTSSSYTRAISKIYLSPSADKIEMWVYDWLPNDSNISLSRLNLSTATTSKAGVMSAADKTKLDSMSTEWTGTQSEFDALTTKDDNIIYYVTE